MSALNSEDLPALGIPTMPIRVLTGALAAARERPRRAAEQRAGEHVGGVVHAEVQPRQRKRAASAVQRRRGQAQARVGQRARERGRGVGAGEAQRVGVLVSGGSPGSSGGGGATSSLIAVFSA